MPHICVKCHKQHSSLPQAKTCPSPRGKGINPGARQAAGIPGLFWHLHFLQGCFPPCQHQLFPSSPWAPSRSSVNARQHLLSAPSSQRRATTPEQGWGTPRLPAGPKRTQHTNVCLFKGLTASVKSLHFGIFYANSVKSASFQFSFMQRRCSSISSLHSC